MFRFYIFILIFTAGSAIAQTRVQGDVSGVWTSEGSPYIAEDDLRVPNGQVLTIQAGVEVVFPGDNEFIVHGRLTVEGTEEDSVAIRPERLDRSWGGLRIIDADNVCVLRYCLITNGCRRIDDQPNNPANSGANIFSSESELVVEHCTIGRGICLGFGAGLGVWGGETTVSHSLFIDNESQSQGGGINFNDNAQATVSHSRFENNRAAWGGGGIDIHNGPNVELRFCEFIENTAATGGGAALYGRRLEAYGCRFIGNHANDYGGAIYHQGGHNNRIHHNLFFRNTAEDGGGAVAVSNDAGRNPIEFTNCTFMENRSLDNNHTSNTGYIQGNSHFAFNSSIIWGDTPHFDDVNLVTVDYCHINENINGTENSGENPGIFALDSSWCLLKGDSPCIDTGDPNLNEDPDDSRTDRG